ncbi:hypothetical protein CEXT_228881 [Caerostris extrusa]|uniref:Uncharacterized protein n=1 Tax=Caerostris extrusa TaxID=172846 RepID=A0AAV4NR17_CAEEX|nr:hypothetical protein CEXT_228881 [Caerostris extrusa]
MVEDGIEICQCYIFYSREPVERTFSSDVSIILLGERGVRSIASSRSADLKDKERISGHRCINHPKIPKWKNEMVYITFRDFVPTCTNIRVYCTLGRALQLQVCVCVSPLMLPNRVGGRHLLSRQRTPSRVDGGRMELKYANVTYFIQETQLKRRFHPMYQSSYWVKEGGEALHRDGRGNSDPSDSNGVNVADGLQGAKVGTGLTSERSMFKVDFVPAFTNIRAYCTLGRASNYKCVYTPVMLPNRRGDDISSCPEDTLLG